MTFKHWFLALLKPAVYRLSEDGKHIFIKEGFHDWETLYEHIKREHPEMGSPDDYDY